MEESVNLYGAIVPKLIYPVSEERERLIYFDPTGIYKRITLNKTKRWQGISMATMFPNEKGYCGCGCGKELKGKATRWYEPNHADFLALVHRVINGDSQFIRGLMMDYLPYECAYCGKEPYMIETEKEKTSFNGKFTYKTYFMAAGIHADHIISVKNGGGGCWLGNYQFLCHSCNLRKTATDRLLAQKQSPLPLSSLFT